MTVHRPRVLDASAMVSLFSGHPMLMRLLDDAETGYGFLLLPTAAIAQAQRTLNADARAATTWANFLRAQAEALLAMDFIERGQAHSTLFRTSTTDRDLHCGRMRPSMR